MPKININGITREMTAEEIAELEQLQAEISALEPTAEERLSALEKENTQLREAINQLLAKMSKNT